MDLIVSLVLDGLVGGLAVRRLVLGLVLRFVLRLVLLGFVLFAFVLGLVSGLVFGFLVLGLLVLGLIVFGFVLGFVLGLRFVRRFGLVDGDLRLVRLGGIILLGGGVLGSRVWLRLGLFVLAGVSRARTVDGLIGKSHGQQSRTDHENLLFKIKRLKKPVSDYFLLV